MQNSTFATRPPIQSNLSEAESRTRYELAVACRISDLAGLSDFCGGFSAARIPGENAIIMRGQSQHPGLVTASTLFKRGLDEEPLMKKGYEVNGGALKMVQAIFNSRPDIGAALHGHTPASMVFSALDAEILPISQFGTMFHGKVGKTGVLDDVNTDSWCDTLITDLGDNHALLFANHGIVAVGRDSRQAMHNLYAIEQAMEIQIAAMQTGAKINVLTDQHTKKLQEAYWGGDPTTDYDGSREWDAWVELVRRSDPEFDR